MSLSMEFVCTKVLSVYIYGIVVFIVISPVTGDGWQSGSHRVARCMSSPVWRVWRVRRRRSWCAWMFVDDRSIVVWGVGSADDRTAACLCVSPCRRLLLSAISYNKKLCRVCIWLCSVIDSSPSVVCWLYCVSWSFPSSRRTVDLLRRAQYFGVNSVKPYRISHYLFACTFAVFTKNKIDLHITQIVTLCQFKPHKYTERTCSKSANNFRRLNNSPHKNLRHYYSPQRSYHTAHDRQYRTQKEDVYCTTPRAILTLVTFTVL